MDVAADPGGRAPATVATMVASLYELAAAVESMSSTTHGRPAREAVARVRTRLAELGEPAENHPSTSGPVHST